MRPDKNAKERMTSGIKGYEKQKVLVLLASHERKTAGTLCK